MVVERWLGFLLLCWAKRHACEKPRSRRHLLQSPRNPAAAFHAAAASDTGHVLNEEDRPMLQNDVLLFGGTPGWRATAASFCDLFWRWVLFALHIHKCGCLQQGATPNDLLLVLVPRHALTVFLRRITEDENCSRVLRFG